MIYTARTLRIWSGILPLPNSEQASDKLQLPRMLDGKDCILVFRMAEKKTINGVRVREEVKHGKLEEKWAGRRTS